MNLCFNSYGNVTGLITAVNCKLLINITYVNSNKKISFHETNIQPLCFLVIQKSNSGSLSLPDYDIMRNL